MNYSLIGTLLLSMVAVQAKSHSPIKINSHPKGEIINYSDGSKGIRFTSDNLQGNTSIIKLDGQPIDSVSYSVKGRVKYNNVDPAAHLEMLSVFPDNNEYFTRTLANEGTMCKIAGSSNWRAFELPFTSKRLEDGSLYQPDLLDIRLVMPGNGSIELKELALVIHASQAAPSQAWWSNKTGGWLGGILGILGGLIGTLYGFVVTRSQNTSVPFRFACSTIFVSAVMLCFGIVAFLLGQPNSVFYPLVLVGAIMTVVMTAQLPCLKRIQAARELRQMEAMDA